MGSHSRARLDVVKRRGADRLRQGSGESRRSEAKAEGPVLHDGALQDGARAASAAPRAARSERVRAGRARRAVGPDGIPKTWRAIPDPVDYLGLPLNDEGRRAALSYNEAAAGDGRAPVRGIGRRSTSSRGRSALKIWIDILDPVKARLVAIDESARGRIATSRLSGWTAGRIHRQCASHARRLHDRPVGRRHAGGLHHPHEGGVSAQKRAAEQRSGDDDHAFLRGTATS